MKLHYDLAVVGQVLDDADTRATREGWVLLSAEPAGVAPPGTSHQDLINELGWPCRIDDQCCRNRQTGRRMASAACG